MSFNRLCRLLKPTLLCGALAVPGLASTMVSAAPLAVGRARGLPYGARGRGDLGRGAPASGARTALGAPSAAVGAVGSARAGIMVRVSVGGGGRVRGSQGQGWAVGTPGWAPQTHRSCSVGAAGGGVVGHWSPACGPESGGVRRGGNPGSRATGRHCPSPALRAPGSRAVASQRSGPAPLATGPLSPGRGARWAQVRPETGGHGPRSRRLPGSSQAAAPVAGRAAAPSPPEAEGSSVLSQEGAPPASADFQEPWTGGARGRGKRLRQRVPRPGARGAPTPAGGVPTRWGTWRGSEHFLGLSVYGQMCPAVKGNVRL